MKKLLAMTLALLMAFTGTAIAEPAATAAANSWKLTLHVTDASGAALKGAELTVRDGTTGDNVFTGTADAEGQAVATLPEGIYNIRAVDPVDGYAKADSVGLTADTTAELVIRKLTPGSAVTVGSVTKVSGQFFTDLFGNNTSDIDVRAMLHGYNTVAFTNDASYAVDESVVTLNVAASDGLGNKTYSFTVKPGLTYNDGTPITAKDYVFSILLQSAPQMTALGASGMPYYQLFGYDAYHSGDNNVFRGVRLLDDMTFSVSILTDYLPYFYELTYASVQPYPISVIAPGCDIADDGDGAYITATYDDKGNPKGEFNESVLRTTLLDPATGYCSHPTVTCGPYQLVSYDADSGKVVMKANEAYQGNYEGQRPLIENVTLVETKNDTALDAIESGELSIVNKLSDATAIADGNQRTADGRLSSANYLRSGQGFLSFACEEGPTASVKVRQAISLCLDQNTFVTDFTGTYGRPVYSYYGLGQWMAADYINTMDQYVTTYDFDLDAAVKLLERDGWYLNDQGKKFKAGTDTVRYKLLKGNALKEYNAMEHPIVAAVKVKNMTLLPLQLSYAKVIDSRMDSLVESELIPNLKSVGFDVKVTEVPFDEMLKCSYRQTARTYNMFAYASNFTYVFDPSSTLDGKMGGSVNTTGIADGNLYKQAVKLRSTAPGDTETYIKRWIQLMKLYSDTLPTVPLYSNVYFDFSATDVQDYAPNAHWSWPAAILYTWIGQAATPTDLATPGDTGDTVLIP